MGLYRRSPDSRGLPFGISPTASSLLSLMRPGNGRTARIGDQRRRAHGASAVRRPIVRRMARPDFLGRGGNRGRRPPRFAAVRHRPAGEVRGGGGGNLKRRRGRRRLLFAAVRHPRGGDCGGDEERNEKSSAWRPNLFMGGGADFMIAKQ